LSTDLVLRVFTWSLHFVQNAEVEFQITLFKNTVSYLLEQKHEVISHVLSMLNMYFLLFIWSTGLWRKVIYFFFVS